MIFGGGSVGSNSLGVGIVYTLADNFTSTANVIKSGWNSLENVTEQATINMSVSMNKIKMGMMAIGAGAAILGSLYFPVDKAMDFEAQLSSVKAVSGATAEQMKTLTDLSLQMGKATKYSALESAQGIEELIKAGVSFEQIVNGGLEGALSLASAGEISVADSAEIASTALNAFRDDALSVTRAADILAGTANASATDVMGLKMGLSQVSAVASAVKMSFLDTSTALGIFAQNGLKGSDAGTSLKSMLLNLQPTTKNQIELARQLGIITKDGSNAFFDSTGKLKDLKGIADIMTTSFGNMTDQQRLHNMEVMFGTDAIRSANIMYKEGALGVNKMATELQKFTAAQIASERMNNLKGSIEQLSGSFETLMIIIGSKFTTGLSKVVGFVQLLVDGFSNLIDTQIGKYLLYAVGAVGLLITGLGLFITVGALANFISAQAALSFASMGMAEVATAFATDGLVAGLMALEAVLSPLLIEILPIIIAIGALAIASYVLYKGFEDFNAMADGTGEKLSGFAGLFQKIGGAIQGFMEIWGSATKDGYEMSQSTWDALSKIGMLEFVRSMGTWIVRLKGFFSGFYEAFSVVVTKIKDGINFLWVQFNKLAELFGFDISKNLSSMDAWIKAGKILGYIIGGFLVAALVLVIGQFVLMAIAVISATWPLLLIIGIIWLVYYAITHWGEIMEWIRLKFNQAIDWMAQKISSFWDYLKEIPSRFLDWGASIVDNIWNGILNSWDWLKDSFMSLIAELPGGKYIIEGIHAISDIADGSGLSTSLAGPTALGYQNAKSNSYSSSTIRESKTNTHTKEVFKNINLKIDSRDLKSSIDVIDSEDENRE